MRSMTSTIMFPKYWLAVFAVFLVSIASSCQAYALLKRHVALFVFGDSFYDVGNNNYIKTSPDFQANYWPYGETFFGFPTGRTTDGRLIPDFISEYAKLPFIPPYLQPGVPDYTYGVNFASSGAGALVETYQGFVIDLKTQLSHFNKVAKLLRHKLGDEQAKALLSSAIYLISIGTNDYYAPFETNTSFFKFHSPDEHVSRVIGNLTNVIQGIHKIGGRKFGFLNLGPLGCFPIIKALIEPAGTGPCVDEITALAKLHNKALSQVLGRLETQLKGFKYTIFDTFRSISERYNDPSKYGLKEAKMGCCGTGPYRGIYSCGGKRPVSKEYELCDNPRDYIFFDSIHFTDKVNEQNAMLMWSGNSNVTWPYNLKSLFELYIESHVHHNTRSMT